MKNTFGSNLCLTIFGESHGRAVGAVLDGMAAGCPVDEAFLARCMDARRARGDGLSTAGWRPTPSKSSRAYGRAGPPAPPSP